MSITNQFSIQPQPTSVITSIAHIPKWKIKLMHKRKQLQKSKSEIAVSVEQAYFNSLIKPYFTTNYCQT